MEAATQQLLKELKSIKENVHFICGHMADIDSIMTEEDYLALLEYRQEKEQGELTSHQQLKRELSL
ncbi:MAG: hypothetical protein AABX13_05205 [Nanoarchaeota archaeon]